jgi:16S rRNA C967 or C1407 C5-methylase (RsmB/RsmF family)/NOL1/NOP2/fmu family ribosome biogenesis protein
MNPVFKQKTCDLFGWSNKFFDEIFNKKPFRAIRVNPLKADFTKVQESFDFELKNTPFYKDSYYIPSDFDGVGNLPMHHSGGFYVQEPSASSVLSVVNAKVGEKILDLCAAPGGKSTGIAAELGGEGLLWSNEYIRSRASALLSNIERMGITNAVVSSLSTEYLCSSLEGFFDAVVVDAPCSGEGMWRHNVQVEKQWSEEYVLKCSALQKEILSAAAVAVASGGRLIYSTCTFAKEENEENVIWFLKNNPDFTLEKITADFGICGLSGDAEIDSKVRRITPENGGEGHFVALFKRVGEGNRSLAVFEENISSASKKIITEFLEENFTKLPVGVLFEKNNLVYLAPCEAPQIKGDVLRYGLLLGEIRKNRIEPSHALFTASNVTPKRSINLTLDDERLYKFLKGEEIPADGENGYTAVLVNGVPLGFGKCSAGRLTNRYPKGLRVL